MTKRTDRSGYLVATLLAATASAALMVACPDHARATPEHEAPGPKPRIPALDHAGVGQGVFGSSGAEASIGQFLGVGFEPAPIRAMLEPWMCAALGDAPARRRFVDGVLDLAHRSEFCSAGRDCAIPLQKPPRELEVDVVVQPDADPETVAALARGLRDVVADLDRVAEIEFADVRRFLSAADAYASGERDALRNRPRDPETGNGLAVVALSEEMLRTPAFRQVVDLSGKTDVFLRAKPEDIPCMNFSLRPQQAARDLFAAGIVIRLDAGPALTALCIAEEIVNSIGLPNDPPGKRALFEDEWTPEGDAPVPADWAKAASGLPLRPALALRILSDDAFQPGIAREMSAQAMHSVIARNCGE